jgi:hypothetical protein
LGAVVVLAGAYVGWRQLRHNIEATQAQMELQRQGTVTDRYTRAVDQLASTDQTIRVGAIHALNRIAHEAAPERDGVAALLATYVRVRARIGWTDQAARSNEATSDGSLPLRSRAADIQAALTTLTRWIDVDAEPSEWLTADLAHTDLRNANLARSTFVACAAVRQVQEWRALLELYQDLRVQHTGWAQRITTADHFGRRPRTAKRD